MVDDHGLKVTTVRKILEENMRLVMENITLGSKLNQLAADITAQGRAVLGHHTFALEGNVKDLAMLECPSGDAFAVFLDPMVLFNHNAMYVPVSNWEKTTKAMEESGTFSVTDRKVVASYNLQYLFWHSEGKQVVAGKVLATFALTEKWSGTGGLDGVRVEIELSADTAADAVRTMIGDRLPAGSQLAQLAQMMLKHTQHWLLMVHKHLNAELVKLMQMNILEEEALILLSEEVIIMFDRFYAIRRKHMDFVVKGNRIEYMVRCIWILLQVHMAMDDFVKDSLKYNLAISAAFIHFFDEADGRKCVGGGQLPDPVVEGGDQEAGNGGLGRKDGGRWGICPLHDGHQHGGQGGKELREDFSSKSQPQEVTDPHLKSSCGGRYCMCCSGLLYKFSLESRDSAG